ncbi:MAG: hypothetical protein A2V83_09200 [Nitrospirae bacterium RBG_16_64_22]|nr:MAG: hypothetical protein A2V83_09200 [Nitrospirae bacterium RBG_16_64_22]
MKGLRSALIVPAAVVLFFPASIGAAESIEDAYARTVQALNQEGFAGIDTALAAFEGMIERDPVFVKARLGAADAYLLKHEFSGKKDRGWLDSAVRHLNAAVAKDPGNAEALFKRAVVRFSLEQQDAAVLDLRKSMEISPSFLDARILYLQHLLATKKADEAARFAESSLSFFPNDPAPLKAFGDAFFQAKEFGRALSFYKRVIPLVPKAPLTHLAMGKAHQNMKQCDPAIDSFRKALAQNPDLVESHFGLAYCFGEKGLLGNAVGHLEVYSRKVPKDVSALNNLAILYEQTGQNQKARLAWLRVKQASEDAAYRERADRHLYKLLAAEKEAAASPRAKGKTDEKTK